MKDSTSRLVVSLVLAAAFTVWLMTRHGAQGLLHVEYLFGLGVLAFLLFTLLPLFLYAAGKRRRNRSKGLGIAISVLSASSILATLGGFAFLNGFPSSDAGETPPRLLVTADRGEYGIPDIAVAVESKDAAALTLTWGKDTDQYAIREARPSRQHVFVLRNLEPDSQYRYRIADGTEYSFSTPDPTSQPLRFAVGSDAHFGASDSRNDLTREMIASIANPASKYSYFFSLGDNVEYGFRPEEWTEARLGFAPTATIPSVFAAGNHDTLFAGLSRFGQFSYPAALDPGTGTRLWRRFDVGDIHFFIIDIEWSAETLSKEQISWLENELNSVPSKDWTVVLGHGFYFASGSTIRGWEWYDNPETIARLTPIFEKHGVDLVFSGHAHQMELLQKAGVTYVITGAFGGIPDAPREYTSPESLWYAAGEYGYVDVQIENSKAKLRFVDSAGEELKSLVVPKGK